MKNKYKKFILYCLCSMLIHGGLLVLLSERETKPKDLTIIEIELRPSLSNQSHEGQTTTEEKIVSGHSLKNNRSKKTKTLSLSQLSPNIFSYQQKKADPGLDNSSEDQWDKPHLYDQIHSPSLSTMSAQDTYFMRSLWRLIDRKIERNDLLAEYDRVGDVYLKFEIDDQGHLIESSLRAQASDRVLKVIAARALRSAFKDENNELPQIEKSIQMQARFSWASAEQCANKRGFKDQSLSFCHWVVAKNRKYTTTEKVVTYTGYILNHGPWAYEDIQQYRREERRQKWKFDPFTQYRRDPDWNL